MIIFGWTSLRHVKEKGAFYCPQCAAHQDYKLRAPRRWFTLYFIPVIPLDEHGRYVECNACKQTFVENVRDYDPVKQHEAFLSEVEKAARHAMLKMALADGHADEAELVEIAVHYKSITGKDVTLEELKAQLGSAAADQRSVAEYLATAAGMLNDRGKELVMRALLAVALADDNFDQSERDLAIECGKALMMSRAHVLGLLIEADESARRVSAPG